MSICTFCQKTAPRYRYFTNKGLLVHIIVTKEYPRCSCKSRSSNKHVKGLLVHIIVTKEYPRCPCKSRSSNKLFFSDSCDSCLAQEASKLKQEDQMTLSQNLPHNPPQIFFGH